MSTCASTAQASGHRRFRRRYQGTHPPCGGLAKVTALRAVLRSSLLHGLIIDEVTAQALATDKPETTSGKTKNKGRKGK
jgi:hypothetical protein